MYMVRADPTYVSRKSPHLKSRTCLVCIGLASLDCGGVLYISALCVNGCSGKPCLWGSATIFPPYVCECVVRQALFVGESYYISAICVWMCFSGKPYLWGSATIFPPCVWMCCPASLIWGEVLLYFHPVCVNVLSGQALFVRECYYISALCVNVLFWLTLSMK